MSSKIQVVVWNENRHETHNEFIGNLYPNGIHSAISEGIAEHLEAEIRCATLDEPEHGLTEKVLNNADVLIWWGHMAHHEVDDTIVAKIQERVLDGMGLICLHSAHLSKIFRVLMGTSGALKWREAGEKERIWVIEHGHPIANGFGEYFEIEQAEMYGEPFDIPAPDTLVFVTSASAGPVR